MNWIKILPTYYVAYVKFWNFKKCQIGQKRLNLQFILDFYNAVKAETTLFKVKIILF